jgi:class 3 adenylate cyclase/tetratricopeptide (TPR) repeat protein
MGIGDDGTASTRARPKADLIHVPDRELACRCHRPSTLWTTSLLAPTLCSDIGKGDWVTATENVTVLFTDLVNSTELASELSLEAGHEFRRAHFSALRRAVAASGGTEVKTLGDGLMVVFPIASAALSCAVAMQQAVDLDNVSRERPWGLRVGLSAGEVTREDGDYFGDPVVEAARLCARADGGQILISDLVRAMAGRRSLHVFTRLGEWSLKGLPEPVGTLEVGWEPLGRHTSATGAMRPPSRLEIGPTIGVIGRDAEVALLADAFKRVSAGEGREVVLISGEAGIGKTTLATKVARAALEVGAVVLLGCNDEDLGTPYGPFVEALSHYVANATEDALRAHVRSFGAELGNIVPALRQRLGELPPPQSADPDTERYLLYNAVVGLLGHVFEDKPLVLVLDDLQWADKPSLQLLRHVVANTTGKRLLIVGTYRRSELSNPHPLTEVLAAMRRESGVSRIELSGLDDTGVLAYMEAAAGHDMDDEGVGLAHALYRETDGNPFFVGEVLRHLSETGAIYQDGTGRWAAAADLEAMVMPDSVRLVIGSRVARLGQAVSQVLPLAAVIGREFDLDLLARVTERTEDELLDLLDAAAAVALVREVANAPGRYCFAHALIQHTLCQDMGSTRLARAHRQVAEAIEAIVGDWPGPRVGELAYHWFNATQPVNTAKAISYARQAGEAALTALAPEDAVRYFSQALQLVELAPGDDPLLACDLRLGLGRSQRQAGIAAFRETFLDAAHRARQLGATDRLVHAALANNRGWFSASGVIDTDKVAVLEAALGALAEEDSPDRALTLATLCTELSFGPLERRRALADEAKAMARRLKNPATLQRVLSLLNNPLQIPSALVERVADATEALALAEATGDPETLYHAESNSQINAMQAGEFELAARCLDSLRMLSGRLRQPTLMWMTAFKEAGQALMAGDPELAEQLATAALEIGTDSGQPDAFAIYGSQLMYVRNQQGRLGELVSLIDQAVAENPGLPAFRPILACAHLETGNTATALELLDVAAADGFVSLPIDFVWLMAVSSYAQVTVELRATGAAEKLYDLLAPYHEQIPFIGTLGFSPVALTLGGLASILGRFPEAEAYLAEAAELTSRGQMKFFAARTLLESGRMLAARRGPGDLDRAHALLEQARSAAASHGYAVVEQLAAAALSNMP